jgi:hypothetical protein
LKNRKVYQISFVNASDIGGLGEEASCAYHVYGMDKK